MNIYSSEKVLPYVYQCIHKITGKIYIGSRTAKKQKLPSHLDFPKYRTSSQIVKPIFNEFNWYIVAEFFEPQDAYDFEQQLINEQWQVSKEMSLNKVCYYGKKSWNTIGSSFNHLEETKVKIRNAFLGIPRLESHKQNMRKSKPNLKGKPFSEERKKYLKELKRVEHTFLTPNGFIIENTTMKELCSQFNLNYNSLSKCFRNNKSYKGFNKIS